MQAATEPRLPDLARHILAFASFAAIAITGASCGQSTGENEAARIELKSPPAKIQTSRHTAAFASGKALNSGTELKPLYPDPVKTSGIETTLLRFGNPAATVSTRRTANACHSDHRGRTSLACGRVARTPLSRPRNPTTGRGPRFRAARGDAPLYRRVPGAFPSSEGGRVPVSASARTRPGCRPIARPPRSGTS